MVRHKKKANRSTAFQPKCRNPLHESWGSSNDINSDEGHLLSLTSSNNFTLDDIKLMEERGFHNVLQVKSQKGSICRDCWASIKASKKRLSVNADHAYNRSMPATVAPIPASDATESLPSTSEGSIDVVSDSVGAPRQNTSSADPLPSGGTSGHNDHDDPEIPALVDKVTKLIHSNAIPQVGALIIMIYMFSNVYFEINTILNFPYLPNPLLYTNLTKVTASIKKRYLML